MEVSNNMKSKIKVYNSIILSTTTFLVASFVLYFFRKQFDFISANVYATLVAYAVGTYALYLYIRQKEDAKRDAAKIILQEIRRAEDIISDYKEHGQYKFTKKIVATNSWAKNIHHFVGDLDPDELDKISDLYSMGEYLDSIITKISDEKFETGIKMFEENVQRVSNVFSRSPVIPDTQEISGGQLSSGQQPINAQRVINLPITIPAPWKTLLDEITFKYEPIYHSTIADKLKMIARLK